MQNVWHSRILTLHLPDRLKTEGSENATESIVRLTTQSLKGKASGNSTPKEIPIGLISKVVKGCDYKEKREEERSASIVKQYLNAIVDLQEKRPYDYGFQVYLKTRAYLFLT